VVYDGAATDDDDDDVYLDILQTRGVKKCISSLDVKRRLQPIRHKEK
jgi:hypothetical protein